jgi:phosphonate transport system substrate-binding protein
MQKIQCNLKYTVLLGILLCLFCAGCEKTAGTIDFSAKQPDTSFEETDDSKDMENRPLRIAFASVISPEKTRQSYRILVDYLSKKLGRPAVLIQRKTYEDLNILLSNGGADIAFVSTGAYSSYRGMQPIELLAMIQTDGTIWYQTYLIVPRDSEAESFSQLRGKVFAFTDPASYSGRLAIDYLLLRQKVSPEQYFKRCFYTYNHDKSIWAVANHLADAASVDSQIYDYAEKHNPQLTARVRVIDALPNAPSGPVAVRSDMPEDMKERLREIFYHMDEDPEMKAALGQALIDRFLPPEPGLYEELRKKYDMRRSLPGE